MLTKFFLKGPGRYLALLPIPFIWLFLGWSGGLQSLRDQALDMRFRLRGEIPSLVKLIYVDIDSKSIGVLKNFPWNHDLFAEVCAGLIDSGKVNGIGIDVVMSNSGIPNVVDFKAWNSGHIALGRYLFNGAPVVMAASYASGEFINEKGVSVQRAFPLLGTPSADAGALPEMAEWKMRSGATLNAPVNGLIDTIAGGMRLVPLYASLPDRTFYTMGLELARLQLGIGHDGVDVYSDRIELRRPTGELALTVPLKDEQLMEINWFSPWMSAQNPRISFVEVLLYARDIKSDDPQLKADAETFFAQFTNSIVLIGPVDRLLQDLSPTPFDEHPVPKVGVHGNVLKTLLSGRYLHRATSLVELVLTLGLTVLTTLLVLAADGRRGLWSRILAFIIVTLYVAVTLVAFVRFDFLMPMVVPLGSALSTSFLAVVAQLIIEEKQKGRIKGMFGTYVAPALVDRMIASGEEPKLGGIEADITAYFSDIRNFSTFSEQLNPQRLVELMNEYLTACTDLVQAEGGTLDKYIGDALIAIYGAPLKLEDHAYRACVAALNVHKQVAILREKWESEGDKWPGVVRLLQTRIGLNSGPAVVGNMGSATRFNYTMMGDTVNLGARMESGAKTYGVFTMVTAATKLACEAHGGDSVVFRYLDKIQVRGRDQPVLVYEAVGLTEDVTESTRECIRLFGEATELYLSQRWEEAAATFRRSANLEPNYPGITPGVHINPSLVFIERCLFMQANPPGADWNGFFVMDTK